MRIRYSAMIGVLLGLASFGNFAYSATCSVSRCGAGVVDCDYLCAGVTCKVLHSFPGPSVPMTVRQFAWRD